jgi:large subunit ribosomal protein L24
MSKVKMTTLKTKYQKKFKIKKGDEVKVLAGRSKGEVGKIERVDFKKDRVYIAGKNLLKRHQKPNLQNQEGGIVDVPGPIHVSNVALVDSKSGKTTRVGFKVDGKGAKSRVAKKSGSTLD